jgi:hypothetical protein
MALAEVIGLGPATAEVERIPGKCPDCFGTGGVTDEDGSFTGVVGQPMACSCMSFFGCLVLVHPADCRCREREIEQWCTVPAVVPELRRGPSHWWGE